MDKKPKRKGMVCTRYAPSPTGRLHVGGARTALFNYLYAKKNNGKFILRIEDTDLERNVPDGHIEIESSLKLLNIFPDESFSSPGSLGPYRQSQKLGKYREIANQLLSEGKAYRCFCSEEELEEARLDALDNHNTPKYSRKCLSLTQEEIDENLSSNKPFVIRLKTDFRERYEWFDHVRGEQSVPSDCMSDYVLMRSNEMPTYNFSVVVDDIDMKITCVLRGEEHLANTPYQIATYYALGMEEAIPDYAHLSVIVDEDRKKLSKRSGEPRHFISNLIEKGYLSEAIVNFLALLGWSHGETEFFTHDELVHLFDLSEVSKSPTFFDIQKLNWINHKYIQDMTQDQYLNYLIPIFTVNLGEDEDRKKLFALANQNNISYGDELNELAIRFYEDRDFNKELLDLLRPAKKLLTIALNHFPKPSEEWSNPTIRGYLKQLGQISSLKGREFFKPLRIAFSVQTEGFELPNVIECLGRKRCEKNLRRCLELLNNE